MIVIHDSRKFRFGVAIRQDSSSRGHEDFSLDHHSKVILQHTVQDENITKRESQKTLVIGSSLKQEKEDDGGNGDEGVGQIDGNTQELIIRSERNTSFEILIHQLGETMLELIDLSIRSDTDKSSKSGREQAVHGTS